MTLPQSLFESLAGEYYLGNKDNIILGQMHEEAALQAYIEKTNNGVAPLAFSSFNMATVGASQMIYSKEMPGSATAKIKSHLKYKDHTMKEIMQEKAISPSKLKGFS